MSTRLRRPQPGDRVSVVSPCWAGPQHFPRIFDLGLARLREWGLEPVETPTTRVQGTPKERARDLMAAFADPTTTAVFASIGGDDQITVLRHLDPEVLRANPKPFFGYSDNTNVINYLFNLGISSFHGGAVMVQWARAGRIHPVTAASLQAALFDTGPWTLPQPTDVNHANGNWETADLAVEPPMQPADPWSWHGSTTPVSGRLWGGNLEILDWTLGVSRHLLPLEQYAGCVLFLETSEEMPSAEEVYRMLRVMGERDLLQQFAALVFARPKAWSPERPTPEQVSAYTADQRAAVLRAMAEYSPEVPVVIGVDAGHADPMVVMPIGGEISLDPGAGRISVTYESDVLAKKSRST